MKLKKRGKIKENTMKLDVSALQRKATEIRIDTLKSLGKAGSGHPGGSLSMTDVVTALYFNVMNIDEKNPKMDSRDRFVLSKGHAAPACYATLAHRGFFPIETLDSLRQYGSILQGHPDSKKIPGVDISTGSLGQGISVAVGMAKAMKLSNHPGKVYCILGDGECQEGQVWEAFMSAAHYKLDNLIVFIDNNNLQIDGNVDQVMGLDPLPDKMKAFGFHVQELDGNDMNAVVQALDSAKQNTGKPTVLIGKTIKGKGVSFMENQASWHGAAVSEAQCKEAVAELEQQLASLKQGGN